MGKKSKKVGIVRLLDETSRLSTGSFELAHSPSCRQSYGRRKQKLLCGANHHPAPWETVPKVDCGQNLLSSSEKNVSVGWRIEGTTKSS